MKSILRETLKRKNITVTELAKRTKVSRSILSELVNADTSKSFPGKTRMDVIQKIMASLQCSIFEIINFDIEPIRILHHTLIDYFESEKEVFHGKEGSEIYQKQGDINETFFVVLSITIENVHLKLPLLVETTASPESYRKGKKDDVEKVFDTSTLMGNVFFLSGGDIQLLKKYFPKAYEAIPKDYDQDFAYQFIITYPILPATISKFLIEHGFIDFKKFDVNLFKDVWITWSNFNNAGEMFTYKVIKMQDDSYNLITDNNSPFAHYALSEPIKRKEQK